ncbi:MAG TPA: hypothetical protein VLV46_13950, partial [Gaiellaceae bacterium]|nr:hypothetical protein [Gaiellaceae bacterium]
EQRREAEAQVARWIAEGEEATAPAADSELTVAPADLDAALKRGQAEIDRVLGAHLGILPSRSH